MPGYRLRIRTVSGCDSDRASSQSGGMQTTDGTWDQTTHFGRDSNEQRNDSSDGWGRDHSSTRARRLRPPTAQAAALGLCWLSTEEVPVRVRRLPFARESCAVESSWTRVYEWLLLFSAANFISLCVPSPSPPAASAQTEKLLLLQRGAFVPH